MLAQQREAIEPDPRQNSIIPNEVSEEDIEKIIDGYQSAFPLPYVLVVLGYAFILMIDKVIIDAHTVDASKDEGSALLSDQSESGQEELDKIDTVQGPVDLNNLVNSQKLKRSNSFTGTPKPSFRLNQRNEYEMIDEDEENKNGHTDAKAADRCRRRQKEAIRRQLQSYLKK